MNEKYRNIPSAFFMCFLVTTTKLQQKGPVNTRFLGFPAAVPCSAHLSSATNGAQTAKDVSDLGVEMRHPQIAIEIGIMMINQWINRGTNFSDKPIKNKRKSLRYLAVGGGCSMRFYGNPRLG